MPNFRLNKEQAWTLSNLAYYTEDCEIVVNAESYGEDGCFEFALQLKDNAPDFIWQRGEAFGMEDGWIYLTMMNDGTYERTER